MTHAIRLRNLTKSFRIKPRPAPSLLGAVRGLVAAKRREFRALDDVSFEIEEGERVALIGTHGAGKSTTLKILSGILQPDAGEVRVLDLVPTEDCARLGYRIGTISGHRSELWQHLPASDVFRLLAKIYGLPNAVFHARLDALVQIFALASLLSEPVRGLSPGERMRFEMAAGLLHGPAILFLDEPTFGLDELTKARVRELIRSQSEREGTTVLLTSRDTADSEVCERVIVLNHGKLLFNQSLSSLRASFIRHKHVTLLSDQQALDLSHPGVRLLSREPYKLSLEVDVRLTSVAQVVQAAQGRATLRELTVRDPPLEQVIQAIQDGASAEGPEARKTAS